MQGHLDRNNDVLEECRDGNFSESRALRIGHVTAKSCVEKVFIFHDLVENENIDIMVII